MFIRIYKLSDNVEILINTNMIWKIEVTYANRGHDGHFHMVPLKKGLEDPKAIRLYKVFFGSETSLLTATPGDPVIKVLEEIYKQAVKGPDKPVGDDSGVA